MGRIFYAIVENFQTIRMHFITFFENLWNDRNSLFEFNSCTSSADNCSLRYHNRRDSCLVHEIIKYFYVCQLTSNFAVKDSRCRRSASFIILFVFPSLWFDKGDDDALPSLTIFPSLLPTHRNRINFVPSQNEKNPIRNERVEERKVFPSFLPTS